MIEAGRLKKRVTFQRDAGATRDSFGEPEEDWQDVATVWASITPLTGTELWYARQTTSVATHKIVCRWSADTTGTLTAKDRAMLEDGRVFNGDSVKNVNERRRRVEFTCFEAPLPPLFEVIDDSGSRALLDDTGRNFSNFGHGR